MKFEGTPLFFYPRKVVALKINAGIKKFISHERFCLRVMSIKKKGNSYMKVQQIIKVISCVLALSGCVSVESVRTQLSSTNPNDVKEAKEQVFRIVTEGRDKSGFVNVDDPKERIEYLELVANDNSMLISILDKQPKEVIWRAAIERLDFSKPGLGRDILMNHGSIFSLTCKMEKNEFTDRWIYWLNDDVIKDLSGFPQKVVDSMTDQELMESTTASNSFCAKVAIVGLLKRTKDVNVLTSLYHNKDSYEVSEHAARALGKMPNEINDEKLILELLGQRKNSGGAPVLTLKQKKSLIVKLPKAIAEEYAMKGLKEVAEYEYDNDSGINRLRSVAYVATISKDKEFIKRFMLMFGERLGSALEYNRYGWNKTCEEQIKKLMHELPIMDAKLFKEFVAINTRLWPYCIDFVDAELAYDLLAGGNCNSENMEAAVLKKVPAEKIDAKLYFGIKYDSTKQKAVALMSDEKKSEIATLNEAAFSEICDKAKSAAKETFVLDGFYLGMSYEEAKVVFAHHFPEMEINEKRDGEGKDADYVFYIAGQRNPFCFANASDKKVYQFNFGKKLLKKWYKFDVQTDEDWARAYGRATNIDLRFKFIEDNTVTMTDDKVWFRQDSYQYKNNTKGYRITYFGEERNFTARDGLGGNLVKGLASDAFRYVRGDQGMIRVRVEND